MKKRKFIISLLAFSGVLLSSCALARQKQELVWSKWYNNGDGTHTRHNVNDISQSETDVHHFILTSTLEEPTEVTPGKAIYTCEQCACKEEKVVPPTGNYVFNQKVVDDKYLLERYSEHSAAYYMSSVEGAFGDPRYVFEVSDVPSGYTEVDYVESDGRQWIDTGVKNNGRNQVNVNNGSRLGMDYTELEYIESNGTQFIKTGVFGCAKWTITIQFTHFGTRMLMGYNGSGGNYWGVAEQNDYRGTEEGDYETYNSWAGHLKAGNKDVIIDDFGDSIEGQEIRYLNGVGAFGPRAISTDVSDSDYELLALDNGKAPCYAKLYSVKAEKKGVLVCDLVPAERESDKKAGLFDTVSGRFLENFGEGEFIKGPKVKTNEVRLPEEYQEIESIQSTGTQFINTGYQINSEKAKIVASLSFDINNIQGLSLFGSNGTNYDLVPYHYDSYGEGVFSHWVGSSQNLLPVIYANGYNEVTYELNNGNISCNVNSNSYNGTYTGSIISGKNLYIFGKNGNGTSDERGNGYTLHSFKLYDNDALIRDLVPCYRILDDITGLYDLVSHTFFTNEGTGEFLRGGDIRTAKRQLPSDYQELEYIESTGNQQINLNTPFDLENGSLEIDFQATVLEQTGMIIGNFAGDYHIRYLWLYHYSLGSELTIYLNGDTQTQQHLGSSPLDLEKHNAIYRNKTFFLDNVNKGSATGTLGSSDTLYLFSSGSEYFYSGKIYNFKLNNGNGLVRNLIPCYRLSDGVTGMYDLVSEQLFINSGTGSFLRGPEVQSSKAQIPVEYQQVEYVRSDGNQWINAQVVFNEGDTAGQVVDVQFLDTSMRWCGANWFLQYGFDPNYVNTHDRAIISQQFNNKNLKTFVNGTLISDQTFERSMPANIGTGVFRLGDSNGAWYETQYDSSHPSSQILYSLKIYKNSVLMRDFVPCYKKSSGEIGLFDLVSTSFFANEGTSPLIKGDDVNVVDGTRDYNTLEKANIPDYYYQLNYVESTGLQSLDTGIVGGAKIDTTMRFIKNSSLQFMGYSYTDGHIFGVGADNKYIGTTIEAGNIDNIVVDFANAAANKASLKINDEPQVNFDITALDKSTLKFFSAGIDTNRCVALMYSAKIYQGETLVRDFVPVMQKQTRAVGLYDLVNQRFYESTTAYSFEAGGIMYSGLDTSNINVFCNLNSNKSHPYSSKISSYKVYEGNRVVRDYISVVRNSDGVAGLYDLKNNEFKTSDTEFPLTYGMIIGHKLDEGRVAKKPTYNEQGEMIYKCIYTGEEIHVKTDCTAYKVTFLSNNGNLNAVKIFNNNDPSNYYLSMVGYTRNINTYNYSKSGAYILFEIPDDGNDYVIESSSGKVKKVEGRQYRITNITGDAFVQLRIKNK